MQSEARLAISAFVYNSMVSPRYGRQVEKDDTVVLKKDGESILEINPIDHRDEFYTTAVQLPYPSREDLDKRDCLFNYRFESKPKAKVI